MFVKKWNFFFLIVKKSKEYLFCFCVWFYLVFLREKINCIFCLNICFYLKWKWKKGGKCIFKLYSDIIEFDINYCVIKYFLVCYVCFNKLI